MPLMAFTDYVAIRWQAYNSKGLAIDTTCYSGSGNRRGVVNYYGDNGLAKTQNLTLTYVQGFDCLRTDFKMSQYYMGDTVWAKSGYLVCKIDTSSPDSAIHHLKVQAAYCHKEFFGTISISYPGSISISFDGGKHSTFYRTAEITSSVKYID